MPGTDRRNSSSSDDANSLPPSRQMSQDGSELIPTRMSKVSAPKPASNPLQFIKVGPCDLYKAAQEQIKKVEEIKKVDKVKDESEDWQSNLDNWKCSRRKRQEHIIERVVEVKKLELEEHDRNRKRSKTFNEMMEERTSKGGLRKMSLMAYPDDDDVSDLTELGLGGTAGETLDNDRSNGLDNGKYHEGNGNHAVVGSNGHQRHASEYESSTSATMSSPEPEEYTYERAIQGYMNFAEAKIKTPVKTVKAVNGGTRPSSGKKEPGSKVGEKLCELEQIRRRSESSIEVPDKQLPKVDVNKRRSMFERSSSEAMDTKPVDRVAKELSSAMTVKERLETLEKTNETTTKVSNMVKERQTDLEKNSSSRRQSNGEVPSHVSIKERLNTLEKQCAQAETRTSTTDISLHVSIKERVSHLDSACNKEAVAKLTPERDTTFREKVELELKSTEMSVRENVKNRSCSEDLDKKNFHRSLDGLNAKHVEGKSCSFDRVQSAEELDKKSVSEPVVFTSHTTLQFKEVPSAEDAMPAAPENCAVENVSLSEGEEVVDANSKEVVDTNPEVEEHACTTVINLNCTLVVSSHESTDGGTVDEKEASITTQTVETKETEVVRENVPKENTKTTNEDKSEMIKEEKVETVEAAKEVEEEQEEADVMLTATEEVEEEKSGKVADSSVTLPGETTAEEEIQEEVEEEGEDEEEEEEIASLPVTFQRHRPWSDKLLLKKNPARVRKLTPILTPPHALSLPVSRCELQIIEEADMTTTASQLTAGVEHTVTMSCGGGHQGMDKLGDECDDLNQDQDQNEECLYTDENIDEVLGDVDVDVEEEGTLLDDELVTRFNENLESVQDGKTTDENLEEPSEAAVHTPNYENIVIANQMPHLNLSGDMKMLSGLSFPLGPTPVEPPKEKPPPPPVELSDEETTPELPPKPSLRRLDSTRRIKKEIRKKRSDFLGIEGSTDDNYLEPEVYVSPPPDMMTFLQEERRLEQQLYRQSICSESDSNHETAESRDSGVELDRGHADDMCWSKQPLSPDVLSEPHSRQNSETFGNTSITSEEDEIMKKEREIIEVLEKEEQWRYGNKSSSEQDHDIGEKLAVKLRQLEQEKMQLEWERAEEEAARKEDEERLKAKEQQLREQEKFCNSNMDSSMLSQEALRSERERLVKEQAELDRCRKSMLQNQHCSSDQLDLPPWDTPPTRHSMQEAPPSARHLIQGAPPSTRHSIQEAPSSTRLSIQGAPPSTRHLLQEAPPSTRHSLQEAPPSTRHSLHEAPPSPRPSLQEAPPSTRHSLQEAPPSTRHSLQEAPPSTRHSLLEAPPPRAPTTLQDMCSSYRYSLPDLQQRPPPPAPLTKPLRPLAQDQWSGRVPSVDNIPAMEAVSAPQLRHGSSVPHINQANQGGQQMSRSTLHALSAAPRSRIITNENWIQPKRKSDTPKGNYNYQHWLIQEAEHRRILEQQQRVAHPSHQLNRRSFPSHTHSASAPSHHTVGLPASPQPHKWLTPQRQDKPLPDSVIQTLTQRAQNRSTPGEGKQTRRRLDLKMPAAPIVPGHELYTQPASTLPPLPHGGDTREARETQERMLSVSGKKKCSHCDQELGRGAAMIIESLRLFYHIDCFKCCVCHVQLGDGLIGTDVRVRNNKLHCHNCYSSDDGVKFSCV